MNEKKEDFKKAFKAFVEKERQGKVPLEPEELLKYSEGELSGAEEEGFLDRLVEDKGAVTALNQLQTFDETASPPMSQNELETAWRDFKRKASDSQGDRFAEGHAGKLVELAEPLFSRRAQMSLLGLIAWLSVVILALSIWAISLWRTNHGLAKPSLNAVVTNIYFDGPAYQGIRVLPIDPKMRRIFQIQLQEAWPFFSHYRFEIFSPNDRLLFVGMGQASAEKELVLLLPPSFFKESGSYTVRISGLKNGAPVFLDSFSLENIPG